MTTNNVLSGGLVDSSSRRLCFLKYNTWFEEQFWSNFTRSVRKPATSDAILKISLQHREPNKIRNIFHVEKVLVNNNFPFFLINFSWYVSEKYYFQIKILNFWKLKSEKICKGFGVPVVAVTAEIKHRGATHYEIQNGRYIGTYNRYSIYFRLYIIHSVLILTRI